MARRVGRRELDEDPSPEDVERFSGVTQSCRNCGTELYDDATVCWKCGGSPGGDGALARGWPAWAYVTVIGAMIVAVLWFLL